MLEGELKRAEEGYYRLLAIINTKQWRQFLFPILSEFLDKKHKNELSIAYAFHPWIKEAKDRFFEISSLFKGNNVKEILDIDYSDYNKYLGRTFDLVILDTVDDFRPNYISALSDSVRGGGLVIIYSDDIMNNKLFKNSLVKGGLVDSYFENRFLALAKNHEGILVIDDEGSSFRPFTQNAKAPSRLIPKNPKVDIELHKLCISEDQNKSLDEMSFITEGKGKRVLAITAPRGRGKSSVVGLFLSFLVKSREYESIVITSPTYMSSQEMFKFLVKGLKALKISYKALQSKDGKVMEIHSKGITVKWLAPDLAKDYKGDLIVVDEAAAVGLDTINYILNKWEKVILVTTIHGYEGTGKAFLKYLNFLRQKYKFKHITLSFPVRYAKGDPVERFLYDVMLLDAEPKTNTVDQGNVLELERSLLFKNEGLLRQIYGILVTAHYRNSPDDLMILGDLHYQRIFTNNGIGVAQIVEEGNLSQSEINTFLSGGESSGDLIPQRLIKYDRLVDFGALKGWRVMRIAVHPEYQGKGYGSRLLDHILRRAEGEGLDWVGSSFSSDIRVIQFWVKNGFIPVHLSSRKNEGLNGYSIIVIKPLSELASKISGRASELLREKILRTSHQVYFNVNPLTLDTILRSLPVKDTSGEPLPEEYKSKLEAYLSGYLPYNAVADAVHYVLYKYFTYSRERFLDQIEEAVLISRTLQGKSWYHISLYLDIKPRIAEEYMRSALVKLLGKM
ncbi:tRNA(Met) cytidine acetyltransferase TmcA [Stygiolobus caldivivus]|uniref:tRNA(Met) cytidine acetyltransferase TmcA n=1 Tax=Stygiolobus caldivivus TaxID=2824673 RepID=A0A8D5U4A5_9CREN|nr:GNAT family N-acetyltransferase [Stygiolobus caldivivus]BCU69146.1 tRNA(Met) cytidine acetyltransferase [Stygiolobus caldivivus]